MQRTLADFRLELDGLYDQGEQNSSRFPIKYAIEKNKKNYPRSNPEGARGHKTKFYECPYLENGFI